MAMLFIFLTQLITLSLSQNTTYYEAAIQQAVFSGYSSSMRPVDNVNVSIQLQLAQIISLKEPTETLVTSSYLFVVWKDPRLAWDPTQYGQITAINIPASLLWLPDLYVVNTASSNGFISYSGIRAFLFSNGGLCMNVGLIGMRYMIYHQSVPKANYFLFWKGMSTHCKTDIYKFPNDKQTV